MATRPPTVGQVAVAVAFAFSCFGLLLFLWSTFGGPVPLKPEGYRIEVPFKEATQLAVESDVRISNVPVGKVKKIDLSSEGPNRDRAVATLEIDNQYAPLPANTRAIQAPCSSAPACVGSHRARVPSPSCARNSSTSACQGSR